MAVSFQDSSHLRYSELLEAEDVQFWDLSDLPDIPVSDGDLYYQVQRYDRLDTLANRFYGDPVYRWLILAANDLEMEPYGLIVGESIRIPDPVNILDIINRQSR